MIYTSKLYRLNIIYSIIFSFILSVSIAVLINLIIIFSYINISYKILIISIAAALIVFILSFYFFTRKYRRRKKIASMDFPKEWDAILNANVSYYSNLDDEDKKRFKQEVLIFLNEKTIRGIETDVDDKCKVLVAASGIIPVFSFPEWEYDNLSEILIYPKNFNEDYDFTGKDRNILGLVTSSGSTMILSKPSLYQGFANANDKLNVGIHEFIHKVDGLDGAVDGIPAKLADKKAQKELYDIMIKETENIKKGKSDINPYALTNSAEFFAVVSEYFFENPQIMSQKHPDLYRVLKKIFRQDSLSLVKSVVKSMFIPNGRKLGRNDPCPCGSGKKYKNCCLDKIDN